MVKRSRKYERFFVTQNIKSIKVCLYNLKRAEIEIGIETDDWRTLKVLTWCRCRCSGLAPTDRRCEPIILYPRTLTRTHDAMKSVELQRLVSFIDST